MIDRVKGMTKIIEGLYIGNSQSCQLDNLADFKIDSVLNVAFDLNDPFSTDYHWYKVGLIDGTGNTQLQVDIAYKLLTTLMANKERVLIHCHEGLSRSVYTVYLFLTKNGMDQKKATILLNDKIPNNRLNKWLI